MPTTRATASATATAAVVQAHHDAEQGMTMMAVEAAAAAALPLPGSPALGHISPNASDKRDDGGADGRFRRSIRKTRRASGDRVKGGLANEGIHIARDETADDDDIRGDGTVMGPRSPMAQGGGEQQQDALLPKSHALQVAMREKKGLRSTSNKENESPVGQGLVGGGPVVNMTSTSDTATVARSELQDLVVPDAVLCDKVCEVPAMLGQEVEANTKRKVTVKSRPSLRQSLAAKDQGQRQHKSDARKSSGEAMIPHSKPRPMSLSFPSPPPPAKSTRPPTRPTFQLPGEAVAARLKAAREARVPKEVPEPKPVAFKARPVPKTISEPSVVRQTKASQARQSLAGTDRRSSLAPVRSSLSRLSIATPDRRASIAAPVRDLGQPARQSSPLLPKSAQRPALSTRGPDGNLRTDRGKAVFQRAAQGLAEQERQRREKEDAARKARAEAAERGRLASQLWAERQKAKMSAAKRAAAAEVKQ